MATRTGRHHYSLTGPDPVTPDRACPRALRVLLSRLRAGAALASPERHGRPPGNARRRRLPVADFLPEPGPAASPRRPDENQHVRTQVSTARISGRWETTRAEGPGGAAAAERARARASATGSRGSEDAEPDGGARGAPLCAVRASSCARGRPRRHVPTLRRGPAQLRAVRVVRHERALGVRADGDGARGAQGRAQRVLALRSAYHGRAPDRYRGSARGIWWRGILRCAPGVRRPVQVTEPAERMVVL